MTTTRLGLYEPVNTDVPDVDKDLSEPLAKVDDIAFVTVCTTATSPTTNRYTGRLIFRTDTQLLMRWNGTSWEVAAAENRPRGRMGFDFGSETSATCAAGAEIGPIRSVTFNTLNNRTYLANFGCSLDHGTGNDASAALRVRWSPGSSVSVSGTLLGTHGADVNDNTTNLSVTQSGFFSYASTKAQQITMGLFVTRPATGDAKTVRAVSYQWLGIEDVGV